MRIGIGIGKDERGLANYPIPAVHLRSVILNGQGTSNVYGNQIDENEDKVPKSRRKETGYDLEMLNNW
jgi:hypothetical protein